jgi:hypothetical protein
MRRLRRFAHFWWTFVVGDDGRLALGVLAALGVTAVLVSRDVNAWWLLPPAVAVLLWLSVARAARRVQPGTAARP